MSMVVNDSIDTFPKRRDGVWHAEFGGGVCVHTLYDTPGANRRIKFDDGERWVAASELTPMPSRAVSPDPATSRNSGWVSGRYSMKRDLKVKGGLLCDGAVEDIESFEDIGSTPAM